MGIKHFVTFVHPSPVARRLLLHLFSIRRGFMDAPMRNDPFAKPGACACYVESGHGELRLDKTAYRLEPGPTFWLYSTERTRFFVPAPGERLITQAIWFGGPSLEGWLEELDARDRPEFVLRRPTQVQQLFDTMRQLVRQHLPNWEWRVHLLLVKMLGEFLLSRDRLNANEHTPPMAIAHVLNAIEADRSRDWKINELAALAGMSYSSFGTLFREAMHESPHAYLQRARLDQARELLADQKLRIKEVARRLHFSSVHYFSSFFHKHEGVTPTEFRQHLGLNADPQED